MNFTLITSEICYCDPQVGLILIERVQRVLCVL